MSTVIKHNQFVNHKVYTTEVAGRPLSVDVGKVAELANASALVKYGETTVMVAVAAVCVYGDTVPDGAVTSAARHRRRAKRCWVPRRGDEARELRVVS